MDKNKDALRLYFCTSTFLVLISASGCSSLSMPSLPSPSLPSFSWFSTAPKPDATAEMLFEEGMGFLNNKRYVLAIDRFQRIKTDHPFSPQLVPAELKIAEAYYLNKQYPEAIAAFKEFQSLHPTNENIPFVIYHLGLAHFDQFTSIDRDQKMTETAKGYFETVAKNHAASPYAEPAKEKLAQCLEYLAEHEFIVGSFYLREKKYPAARERFEEIVRRYPDTPTAVKALYHLGESYRLQKNSVKAGLAYEALLQHYPESPMSKEAQNRLALIEKEKQDPMALLLMRDQRPTFVPSPLNPNGEDDPKAQAKWPSNLVAKKEVVHEEPGEEKGLFSRVLDSVNPFSSSSDKKEQKGKAESAKKEPPAKEKSDGFLASVWGTINPFSGNKKENKAAAAKNPNLVSKIDESLQQQGVDPKAQDAASSPPQADLPKISEAPPPPDATELLGKIDDKLEKQGKNTAELPPAPEAAPILKTGLTEEQIKAVSKPKGNGSASPVASGLIESIDQALDKQGIEPAKIDTAVKTEEKKGVTARQPEQKIELSPRLSVEKKPYLLDGDYQLPQKESKEKEGAGPQKAEPPQELPKAVVKEPAPPQKEKPAEVKTAEKAKSPDEEENKGLMDQMKESIGNIGKVLNPFSW